MTAAGKVPPPKSWCSGVVLRATAIQTAKNMGAIVRGDVSAAAASNRSSDGRAISKVDFEEDGSGAGGYAKEMSAEWHAAARDAAGVPRWRIATTALIPGRKAPVMIDEEMVKAMGSGSVTVDWPPRPGVMSLRRRGSENRDGNGVICLGTRTYRLD